jgi:acetyltransferase-like isoleucine patch superfamily enzyme
MMSVSGNSDFKAGKHLLLAKQGNFKSGFYSADATITLGNNVNIRSEVVCHSSVFITGDNVFLNEGTQIRCTNSIKIGSNILFSYECILFDTNTHSLDAKDRLQEMIDGYPNQAIQSADIKLKVKTAPIVIGNDVWVGTRAIILKGTTIGNEVIIGAAAVLSGQTIEDRKVVFGNPAQWH